MYHDQGLIPLKLLHFEDGVNVTLGLPIVRTSVDHGTAYDLAGTGKASEESLVAAIKMAEANDQNREGRSLVFALVVTRDQKQGDHKDRPYILNHGYP